MYGPMLVKQFFSLSRGSLPVTISIVFILSVMYTEGTYPVRLGAGQKERLS